MANSLNANLEEGQKVELNDGRIVTVKGGFGMVSFTSGQALMVENASGEIERVSGFDISRLIEKD